MMRNSIYSACFLLLTALLSLSSCKQDAKEKANWKRTSSEVIIRLDADPDGLNPALSSTGYATTVCNQLFSYLLFIDPVSLQLVPQLANAMPTVQDITSGPYAGGVSYAFEIHPEAVWDDGKPVTGHDYVFTLKAVLNPLVNAPRYRPFLAFIKDVQIDPANPKKFVVLTNEKYILGEEAVATTLPVFPAHLYDPEGYLSQIDIKDFTDEAKVALMAEKDQRLKQFADAFQAPETMNSPSRISGSGPYRLEAWEPGQRISLVKKENYWGDKIADDFPALAAYPDKLVFKPIGNAATALAALKAEEIDVIADIDPKDFTDIKQDQAINERFNLATPISLSSFFIYVNTKIPKLEDKRVRQALAHAINTDEIISSLYYGLAERLASPVLPLKDYYNTELKEIPYDPAKAKGLLQAAGWTDSNNNGTVDKVINGQRTELILTYLISPQREISKNIALLMQDNARKAGIGIEIVTKEFPEIIASLKKRDYELSSGGRSVSPTLWDPKQSWHTQGDNRTGFGTAATDSLIDQLRVTLDKNKRDVMYKQLQAAIYDEQPEIYLYAPSGRLAIHKRFETPATAMYPGFFANLIKLKD